MAVTRIFPLVFALSLAATCAQAQESAWDDPIETERKMFTPTTNTIGSHVVMFESSYTFFDKRDERDVHSYPESLIRFGLSEVIETRLGWNFETEGESTEIGTFGISGSQDFLFGAKLFLTEQDGWLPESSVILEGHKPKGGENRTQFRAIYVFGWDWKNEWGLDAAIRFGTDSEEEDNFSFWSPSIVLHVPITECLESHFEYIGLYSHARERAFDRHLADVGLTYLVTQNIEIGTRIGVGLNRQSATFFANAGAGVRF